MTDKLRDDEKELIQIIDAKKVLMIKDVYETIKSYYENTGVYVSYNLNISNIYPLNTVSSITLTTNKLDVKGCKYLLKISKLANNISITPLIDGRFDYTLTFYDTMITIDEDGVISE